MKISKEKSENETIGEENEKKKQKIGIVDKIISFMNNKQY